MLPFSMCRWHVCWILYNVSPPRMCLLSLYWHCSEEETLELEWECVMLLSDNKIKAQIRVWFKKKKSPICCPWSPALLFSQHPGSPCACPPSAITFSSLLFHTCYLTWSSVGLFCLEIFQLWIIMFIVCLCSFSNHALPSVWLFPANAIQFSLFYCCS